MKKIALLLIVLIATTMSIDVDAQTKSGKKVLVVYYSWGGNTKVMAQQIHQTVGGDIVEIVPVKAYPTDYRKCVDQAKKEIKANVRPAIKTSVKNIKNYDVVFVGSPNWWSTIAPPVATFLSVHNLAGKVVIPFVTHGGGGMANCYFDIKKLCPNSTVLTGKDVPGSDVNRSLSEVTTWLKGIRQLK